MDNEFKQSEEKPEKKVGKELPKISDRVEIMFKQNRRFELKLGRNYFIFEGREKKVIDKALLSHPDWTPVISNYFVVQEV